MPNNYRGNIDLLNRPEVPNQGGVSTLYSTSFSETPHGEEILIPQVRHGLDRIMTPEEAVAWYYQTGEHLGSFASPTRANVEGAFLSRQQEAIGDFRNRQLPTEYSLIRDQLLGLE